jgi:hypothetical protein
MPQKYNGSLYPSFTKLEDSTSLSAFISSQQEEPLSYSSIFKISADEAFQDSATTSLFRMYDLEQVRKISEGTEMLSTEEANSKYAQYGLKFDKPVTKIEADYLAEQKYRSIRNRQMMQEGVDPFLTGATSFAGSMFGAMSDPLGLAASVIPITKIIPGLKAMEASKQLSARLGARFFDAAIGNAIIEPMPIIAAQYDQRDYTAVDSMANIFAGGLFGVGFGALGEGFKYMSRGNKYNTLATGLKEYSNGLVPRTMQNLEEGAQTVTGLSYKQLIDLPDENLTYEIDPNFNTSEVFVRLNSEGPLSELYGRGVNNELAKQNLRQKLGIVLENEDIIRGYNPKSFIEQITSTITEKFELSTQDSLLVKLTELSKEQPNLLHHIYTSTEGGKNLDAFIGNLNIKETKVKTGTRNKKLKRNNQKIDDIALAIEEDINLKAQEVAKQIEFTKLLSQSDSRLPSKKELFKQIEKDHLARYTKKQEQLERDLTNQGTNLELKRQELEYQLSEKQKQLDNTNNLDSKAKINSEIEQLNTAINSLQNDINLISKKLISKKLDIQNKQSLDLETELQSIQKVIKQLEQDPRGLMELRDIINKSQQNTEKLFVDPNDVKERDTFLESHKDATVEELNIEAMDNLKDVTMYMEKYDAATRSNLGLLDENVTRELKLIQQEADDLAQFRKDYLDYIECRRTEGL